MSAEEKWRIFRDEILRIMYGYDAMASGVRVVENTGNGGGVVVTSNQLSEVELLCIRRQCNRALLDACDRHRREFQLLAGEPIEPQMHFGSATVAPVGGA